MGRLIWRGMFLALVVAGIAGVRPASVQAFDRFGEMTAEATFGRDMTFRVQLAGGAPDRLELLLRFGEGDTDFVTEVRPGASSATYVWDTAQDNITPNTVVGYRWRATDDSVVTVSPAGTLLYDDDRPSIDWRSERIGEATVHWYGDAEGLARRFGELSAEGAGRAEELLGHELAGPIDIFVYDARDDFFGALGPGLREWTGAAAYPELRTVFMYLKGQDVPYLETAIVHEVTHVIFHDATVNPYHEPARWLNEGIASWSEGGNADSERSQVEFEASGGGLFAFEAITEQFPIGDRGGTLSYAQGTTMVDMIISNYGREAMRRLTAAYRDGSTDAEALEAATDVPADDLYAQYFASYGVDTPQPIAPEALLPSVVDTPDGPAGNGGGPIATAAPDAAPVEPVPAADARPAVVVLVAAGCLALFAALLVARRAQRRAARR